MKWPRWNSPAAAAATAVGADLFRAKGCVGCHDGPEGADNEFGVAPDLRLLPLVADHRVPGLGGRAYVEQSIRNPSRSSCRATTPASG